MPGPRFRLNDAYSVLNQVYGRTDRNDDDDEVKRIVPGTKHEAHIAKMFPGGQELSFESWNDTSGMLRMLQQYSETAVKRSNRGESVGHGDLISDEMVKCDLKPLFHLLLIPLVKEL